MIMEHIENLRKLVIELEKVGKEKDSPEKREKIMNLREEIFYELEAIMDEVNMVA